MANASLPQQPIPAPRTVNVFQGLAGHEQAISTFLQRVERLTRAHCRRTGKRYSKAALVDMLEMVLEVTNEEIPF